jgi:hypothetical protein
VTEERASRACYRYSSWIGRATQLSKDHVSRQGAGKRDLNDGQHGIVDGIFKIVHFSMSTKREKHFGAAVGASQSQSQSLLHDLVDTALVLVLYLSWWSSLSVSALTFKQSTELFLQKANIGSDTGNGDLRPEAHSQATACHGQEADSSTVKIVVLQASTADYTCFIMGQSDPSSHPPCHVSCPLLFRGAVLICLCERRHVSRGRAAR